MLTDANLSSSHYIDLFKKVLTGLHHVDVEYLPLFYNKPVHATRKILNHKFLCAPLRLFCSSLPLHCQ